MDQIFRELPQERVGINWRFSSNGFVSMFSVHNMKERIYQQIYMILGITFMLVCFNVRKWWLVKGAYKRLSDWLLYGVFIDVILGVYLPFSINLFVGVAGLEWVDINRGVVVSNLVTIVLAIFYAVIPFMITYYIIINAKLIGAQKTVTLAYVQQEIIEMEKTAQL